MQQTDTHTRLRESKAQARAAMTGMSKLNDSCNTLKKQLIRAKADRAELLVDGKEVCWSASQQFVLLTCGCVHHVQVKAHAAVNMRTRDASSASTTASMHTMPAYGVCSDNCS